MSLFFNIKDLNLDNVILGKKSWFCIQNSIRCKNFKNSEEKFHRIFNRIRYLIMLKNNISDVYSHKCTEIKVNPT